MANYAYPNPNTTHTQMSTFECPKYTKAHFCMSQPQYHTYTMTNYAYPNPNTTHTQMSTFVCPKYTKAHFCMSQLQYLTSSAPFMYLHAALAIRRLITRK